MQQQCLPRFLQTQGWPSKEKSSNLSWSFHWSEFYKKKRNHHYDSSRLDLVPTTYLRGKLGSFRFHKQMMPLSAPKGCRPWDSLGPVAARLPYAVIMRWGNKDEKQTSTIGLPAKNEGESKWMYWELNENCEVKVAFFWLESIIFSSSSDSQTYSVES